MKSVLLPLYSGGRVVCSHEGGEDVEGLEFLELAHDAKLFQLGLQLHAVATLSFYGGDAHVHHIGQMA